MQQLDEFRHGTRTSFNRDFYKLEDQTGNVSTVTLNIFQRILRATLGIIATWINRKFCYADTIITQKRINPFEKIQDKEVAQRIQKLVLDLKAVGKKLHFDGLGLRLNEVTQRQQELQQDFLKKAEGLKDEVLKQQEKAAEQIKVDPKEESKAKTAELPPEVLPEVKRDPKTVNVLIVGAQQSGKTILKDLILKTFPIAQPIQYMPTQNSTESTINLNGHTFRIIDTPGLKRHENVDDCILAIQKKAQEVFGGKGFENVDVVLMTCNALVTPTDLIACKGFYPHFTNQTRKFMVVNNGEWLSAEKQNERIDAFLDRGYDQPFKKDEILFSGALEPNDIANKDKVQFKNQLEIFLNLRDSLIAAILPPSVTEEEKAEFEKQRRNEFRLQGKSEAIDHSPLPILVGCWLKEFESMIQKDKHLHIKQENKPVIGKALLNFKQRLDACSEVEEYLSANVGIWIRLRASLVMSIYFKGSESQKGYLNEVIAHIEKFNKGVLQSSEDRKELSTLVAKCIDSAANLGEEDAKKLQEFQRTLA